jgi:isoquinoline 1-oxidoreductase beta subunit
VIEHQSFRDFPLLRNTEMPQVEVHIVASPAEPSVATKACVPAIARAVANAIVAATRKWPRSLPILPKAPRQGSGL